MKPTFFTLLFLFIFSSSYAQFTFEPGYFIDNQGTRTECLIKNMVWRNNPSQFEYKLDLTSDIKIASIATVQEFGINNSAKFVKTKVIIDSYHTKLDKESNATNVDYNEKTLFLNVLEEGDANLYDYRTKHYKRFFFKVGNNPIEQLVYKSFINSQDLKGTELEYVRKYKLQLYKNMASEEITIKEIDKVKFSEKSLRNIFSHYNLNKTGNSKNYFNTKKGNLTNLRARVGLGLANFSGEYSSGSQFEGIKNAISTRIGLEIEYISTHFDGLFSFTAEPTLLRSSNRSDMLLNRGPGKLTYNAFKLPLGIRYNYKLANGSRLYLTFINDLEISFGSKIEYESTPHPIEISDDRKDIFFSDFAVSIGHIKNELSFELRYHFNKFIGTVSGYSIKFNAIDLIFGYQF